MGDSRLNDDEFMFMAEARRNKLVGFWAAEILGRDPKSYAKSVILSDFEEPGDDDVLRKIMNDFQAAGIALSEDDVRAKMDRLFEESKQQLLAE